MKLSAEERADLAEWLWASAAFHEEVAAAWMPKSSAVSRRLMLWRLIASPVKKVLASMEEKLHRAGV